MDVIVPMSRACGLVFALLSCVALAAGGDEVSTNDSRMDPEADRILKKISAYLGSIERFRVHAEILYDEVQSLGRKLQHWERADVYVRRPDRLRADILRDSERRRVLYDGRQLTLQSLTNDTYANLAVPETIDEALDYAQATFGVTVPVTDWLVSDLYANFSENLTSGHYLGLRDAGGQWLHHLIFSNEVIDAQLWVTDTVGHLPYKFVITYKLEQSAPQYSVVFSGWSFDVWLPDQVFLFEPSPGEERIEFIPTDRVVPEE